VERRAFGTGEYALELHAPSVSTLAEALPDQSAAEGECESASASEIRTLEEAGVIQSSPMFEVILGKTYYRNGFFNVPVRFSTLFPSHGSEISIYCGDSRTLMRATVDRKANQTNQTPRIYGRGSLANWFGVYNRLDDTATIRIVSANEIELV
jgi:hypothetical protein